MAEDNQTDADGQQEPGQHAPTTKDVNDAKPKTFTQEEVDRIINERLGRERGRKSDYEELKEKAGHTADLESKLSKALEENEKLKNEAKQAEHEKELSAIRAEVAAKHGITDPSVLVGRRREADRRLRRETHEGVRRHAFPRHRLRTRAPAPDMPRLNIPAARTSSTP